MDPYTVALTSCGRFDLLERTLDTLLPHLEGPLAEAIVIEDSGDRGIHDVVRRFSGDGLNFKVIVNDPAIGQIRSIDRLYAHVGTEWIFHCEDDWEFFSGGFIEGSFAVMQESDRYSTVALRAGSDFRPGYFGPPLATHSGVGYGIADPAIAREFAGMTFNPGLRRMRDYRIVGPYSQFGVQVTESLVATRYSDFGYRVTRLVEPATRHIGLGRHVPDVGRPHALPYRLGRSLRGRMERLRWKLHPDTDPALHARQRMEEARRRGLISNLETDVSGPG